MEGEEAGAGVAGGGGQGGAAGFVLKDERPDQLAVGFGEGEGIELVAGIPVEAAFGGVVRRDVDGAEDAVVEHEPVATALEGALGDEAAEVEAGDGDVEAGLFADFALGALGGGFASVDVELAADGGAEAEVGRAEAGEEEDAVVLVAEIAEARKAVGKVSGMG